MVMTSLSANFGCGSRSRNRFPFVTLGISSSIRQKHVIIQSSRLMKVLLRYVFLLALRIVHESFLWQGNLHMALITEQASLEQRLLIIALRGHLGMATSPSPASTSTV